MKTSRLLAVLLVLFCANARAQTEAPILEMFEARIRGAEMTQMGFDSSRPLLQIRSVREVRLAQDKKGIMLVLKEDDAKILASLTHAFDGRPLMFRAGDVIRPINIEGAVEDGKIGFKYPEAAALADHFRQHFHLAEFGVPAH